MEFVFSLSHNFDHFIFRNHMILLIVVAQKTYYFCINFCQQKKL